MPEENTIEQAISMVETAMGKKYQSVDFLEIGKELRSYYMLNNEDIISVVETCIIQYSMINAVEVLKGAMFSAQDTGSFLWKRALSIEEITQLLDSTYNEENHTLSVIPHTNKMAQPSPCRDIPPHIDVTKRGEHIDRYQPHCGVPDLHHVDAGPHFNVISEIKDSDSHGS